MLRTDQTFLSDCCTSRRFWQGIPGIEVTKKGRIFLTFYSGGTAEQQENYSALIYSDDGIHFSEPVAAAFNDLHRCYDPCLWIDPLGRLWFCWSYAPDHAVYAAICDDPDAKELVWHEEIRLGKDVMMNKPTVLSTGEWLFPIAVWNNGVQAGGFNSENMDPDRKAFAYRSPDQGKTFEKLGGTSIPERCFDEHMILELSDGRLAMYVRTYYGIGVAYSDDRGLTWSTGEDSGLGGPCSRFFIRRLKSGRILLINHYEFTGRNNLTAMLSEDDGKTWPYKLLLYERANVSYPDAVETKDGSIYLTYDRERGGFLRSMDAAYASAREILIARITEEDILAGKLTNPESFLKRVANKLGRYESDEMSDRDAYFQKTLLKAPITVSADLTKLPKNEDIKTYEVSMPSEKYAFLHEAAIIKYHGALIAAWYNNPSVELHGETPIRYAISGDDGKTWSEAQTLVNDESGKILYCPPVFGIIDDQLYLFLNQMVAPDHIHSLDLYLYQEDTQSFSMLWSRPVPFKLNTNVCTLPNGKLLLPGRVGELDAFPNTPAVMIFDSGKPDDNFRIIKLQENGSLFDGAKLVHPELTTIIQDETVYAFSRNDERIAPLVYLSKDYGESWSGPYTHAIPFAASKIYAGTLNDGRNYLIGNLGRDRRKLAVLFSEAGTMNFTKGYVLQDGFSSDLGYGVAWHYPAACEADGKLYVIYTASTDSMVKRGAVVSVIDLDATFQVGVPRFKRAER